MRVLKSLILGLMLLAFTSGAATAGDITPDLGSLDGTQYTNQYFGFQLTLPEGWQLQNTKASDTNNLNLVILYRYPQGAKASFNYSFISVAEKVKGSGVTNGKAYLGNVKKGLQKRNDQYTFNDNLPPVVLDGVAFAVLEAEIPSETVTIKQRFYTAITKDYALSFLITYSSDQELKDLNKILASVRFSKR